MWFFYYTILNKTNSVHYKIKTFVCIAHIYASQKMYLFALFSLIFPWLTCAITYFEMYSVHGICTSHKYFFFKWSTVLQSMYNHMVSFHLTYIPYYLDTYHPPPLPKSYYAYNSSSVNVKPTDLNKTLF